MKSRAAPPLQLQLLSAHRRSLTVHVNWLVACSDVSHSSRRKRRPPEFSRTLCGEIRARSRAHLRRAPRVLIRRRRGRQTMRPFGWGAFLSTASGRLLEVRPAFVPALCFFPPDAVLRFLSSSFNIAPPCLLFRRAAFY